MEEDKTEFNYVEDFFGDIWFGDELANDVAWRDFPDDEDPDDELLNKTPEDVIGILGFDPKEFEEKLKEKGKTIKAYYYLGMNHNMSPGWETVVSRSLGFFKKHIK